MSNHLGPNDKSAERGESVETEDSDARKPDDAGPDGSVVRPGDNEPAGDIKRLPARDVTGP